MEDGRNVRGYAINAWEKRSALADVGADCCFAGFRTNPIVQLDVIQYIKGTGSPDGLSFG